MTDFTEDSKDFKSNSATASDLENNLPTLTHFDESPNLNRERDPNLRMGRVDTLRNGATIAIREELRDMTVAEQKKLERTNSVSLTAGPARVNPKAKVPGMFRTMSIRVTDTQSGSAYASKNKAIKDLSELEWHSLPTADVCSRLGVDPTFGLDAAMSSRRLAKNGRNILTPPPKNIAKKIFWYFFSGFGSLLFGCSIIAFIAWRPLGDPNPQASSLALAVILVVVMVVQACFNALQDYSTGRTMSSITGLLPTDILVFREGNTFKIPASELVAGDIVKIVLGSKVPADVRLLEVSSDLRFDRSILTGESNAINATIDMTDANFLESKNVALQGTLCTSGSGTGVCVQLGDATVFGRIAKASTGERAQKTTLEVEILHFVLIISSIAGVLSTIIILSWAAWLRTTYPDFINVSTLLIDLVSVSVAFLPEGLPSTVVLSLSVIAGAMKKNHILCKSLATVESLGCVSIICSDKTGTLTQNKMTVVDISIGTTQISATEARAIVGRGDGASESIKALASICGICNDAQFEDSGNNDDEKGTSSLPLELRKVNGDATDTGLLKFCESITPTAALRASFTEVGKIAFNSKNKFAVKLLRSDTAATADLELLAKGAPDVLGRRCTSILSADGTISILDEASLASMIEIQSEYASKGQRVLLLAKRIIGPDLLSKEALLDPTTMEDKLLELIVELTIIGLVALVDPPRLDTEETVRICRRAGIRFAMVTGDFSLTATAIAHQIGIITTSLEAVHHIDDLPRDTPIEDIPLYDDSKVENGLPMKSLVLSGSEIITMNEVQWQWVLSYDELVFARTTPAQKLQIVRAFQAGGAVVGVTGDGVNDAPALKQADIGICVAGGSEVAMEAADLILLGDFSSIVQGVEYGRLCFANLRKSILYLLPAGSFSELMPVLVNIFFGLPQVLSNIQMLIICCLTDVLPALSLCYERPEADLLLRKPRNPKTDRLADRRSLGHAYFFLGIPMSLTSMVGAFYFGLQQNGVPFSSLWLKYGNYDVDPDLLANALVEAQSIYFFNLIIMQWFNLMSTRTQKLSIFQQPPLGAKTANYRLFPAMFISFVIAIFLSYVPPIQNALGTSGIPAQFFFLPMAYGTALMFADESRKYYNRGHPNSFLARIAW